MSLSAAGARLESVPRYGSKWARMFFFTRSAYFISSFSSPPQQQLVARPLDGHAARQSFDDYKANVNYPRGLHNMGSDVIAQRQRRDFRRRLDLPRGIYCSCCDRAACSPNCGICQPDRWHRLYLWCDALVCGYSERAQPNLLRTGSILYFSVDHSPFTEPLTEVSGRTRQIINFLMTCI